MNGNSSNSHLVINASTSRNRKPSDEATFHDLCYVFESDMEKLCTALTDALPAIINSISQIVVSLLISFYFSWRLAWPITCLGIVAFLWISIFTAFGMSAIDQETELISKTFQSLTSSLSYRELCNKQYSIGIKRATFFGIVVGSMQLFLFFGMGLGALYGNWLIDEGLMYYPGLIFVIACSIIPAACKLGQIHSNWINFAAIKYVCRHVQRAKDIQSVASIFAETDIAPPNYWINIAFKRKQFLLNFLKNELKIEGEEAASFHPRNTFAFQKLKSSAFGRWKLYAIGFIFCLIFAAGPPTFTYLNGNLYEFYKPDKTKFFQDGSTISWKYLTAGIIACIGGIISTIIFAKNGEAIARKIRCAVYSDCIQRHGAALTDSIQRALLPLLTKSANNCKGAFDARLSQFSVGVFTLAFGIAYVFEKNLASAFLCSICFVIQAINQYVVFRISHIHTKRAMADKNDKGRIALIAFEQLNEVEISTSLEIIESRHDSFLSYSFEKHSSIIPIQALRYTFIFALPQVTQALAYVIGCYLVMEDLVRPVVIYKVVQTLYMSAFSISTIAQYNADVDKARLGALNLKDILTDNIDDSERTDSPSTNDHRTINIQEIL
uniref:ABC transmembrane type-1 domain-containing protein n=1 Tax=Panagrolaimus superbus TaxID=310955 RepID=A0A914YBC9_9BILA